MRMNWFGVTTVDDIVSGLGEMAKRLEYHAAEKEAEVTEHLAHASNRRELAIVAKAHSDRATTIAGKINALVQ